jgi:hypothetical protein
MARSKGDDGVSMMDMVRAALQELGKNAKPTAIQEFIKSKFDKEISKIIISNYKSTMKKKKGGKRRGRPPGSKNLVAVAATASAGSKGIRLEDLTTVRGLVGRLGAGQVRQLVDVLA